jgi:hypothetical protein
MGAKRSTTDLSALAAFAHNGREIAGRHSHLYTFHIQRRRCASTQGQNAEHSYTVVIAKPLSSAV